VSGPHRSAAWEFIRGSCRLRLELRHGKRAGQGINSVFLSCDEEVPATFIIARTEEGKDLATRSELPGQPPLRRMVRIGDQSPSRLVSNELEILGRDTLYEEVLRMASELAPALSPV
jgi:hypothetical protein